MAGRFRLYTDTDVDIVSNDRDMKAIAVAWFAEGRSFPRLAWWPRSHYTVMSPGDFVEAFEELSRQDDPFAAYPIVHIKRSADSRSRTGGSIPSFPRDRAGSLACR